MMTSITSPKQPKGLYMLFTTEMWERFNFYGMRALLTLFLVNAMMFSEKDASLIYGAYLGLSYLTPMIGGYMADNVWGNRKSILIGGILMSLGQFTLFVSASLYNDNLSMSKTILWIALGIIIFGSGLFKPNISSMVGQLYNKGDSKLDSAYTIFYMGINLGAFLGMIICPLLGDVHDSSGTRVVTSFKWGFLASGIAMALGVLIFLIFKHKYLHNPEGIPVGVKLQKDRNEQQFSKGKKNKLFSTQAIVLAIGGFALLLSVFYFISDGGMVNFIYALIYASGISLALFVLFGDRSLTKEEKEKITVLYIVSFFVIFFWACFEQAGSSLTFIADYQTDRTVFGFKIPPSAVQNANSFFIILLAFPIAFFWSWLEKKNVDLVSPAKQAIGLILLSIGYFIIALQVKDLGHSDKMMVIWLFVMYLFHTLGELCLSPIGLSLVSKLAPIRFVSLLMGVWFLANASGYALAGTLGSLLPPTGDKYAKAEEMGFSLQTILDGDIQLNIDQINQLKDASIPLTYPLFFGVQIEDLFDFFMLFVILSFFAGALLLLICPLLKRMMHEDRLVSR